MTNPQIRIHNQETGEIVDREMTVEEFTQYKVREAETQAQEKAEAQKAADKAALLSRLGITADEAKLLLG